MVTGSGEDGVCQGMGTCVPGHVCGRGSWVVVTSGLREHRGSLCRKGPKQLPEPSSLVNLQQYRKPRDERREGAVAQSVSASGVACSFSPSSGT